MATPIIINPSDPSTIVVEGGKKSGASISIGESANLAYIDSIHDKYAAIIDEMLAIQLQTIIGDENVE